MKPLQATAFGLLLLVIGGFTTLGDRLMSVAPAGGAALSCSYTPVTAATYKYAYTGATPSGSGGTAPYTFSKTGTLPTGMSLNTSTGVISGTDTADFTGATYASIQVIVTDNVSATANCSTAFTITVAHYQGPADVQSGWTAWYGVRAYSYALATGGATTTPVVDVRGPTSGTSCTIYLNGESSEGLDLTTTGVGGVGNQCALGATTFCTVTNSSCTVSKWYDQTAGNGCGAATCNLVQATTANQPTFTMPGSCSYPNSASIACLVSNNASKLLASANNFTPNASKQQTLSVVANRSVGTSTAVTILFTNGSQDGIKATASASTWALLVNGVGGQSSVTASDAAWHAGNGVMQAGANAAIFNLDGTEVTSTNTPGTTAGAPQAINGASSTTIEAAEVGFLDNFIASQTLRTNLCKNQVTEYGTTAGTHCS